MSKLKEINGKYYQECEVVMLDTDKKATFNYVQLCIDTDGVYKGKLVGIHQPNLNRVVSQHLYFLSNEEIKDGEPHIFTFENFDEIIETHVETKLIVGYSYNRDVEVRKKIIATTDISLGLPQPSKEFLQAFIKAYNECKLIKKVLVEYENSQEGKRLKSFGFNLNPVLKVNSSNEITIKKIKDSWTREELAFKIKEFLNQYGDNIAAEIMRNDLDEWLEENL